MSRENVETVRHIYANATTPAAFDVYDPHVEWDMTNYHGWMDQDVYLGHEGVRTFMRGWITSFERWEPRIERVEGVGDHVVAVISDRAWPKGGSAPMLRRFGHIFTFRGDRIVRARLYSDVQEALEAVGLSE